MFCLPDHLLYILSSQLHFLLLVLELGCLLKILFLHFLNVREQVRWFRSVLLQLTGFQIDRFSHLAKSQVIEHHKAVLFELILFHLFELFANFLQLLLGLSVLLRKSFLVVGQVQLLLNLLFLGLMETFCVQKLLTGHDEVVSLAS